MTADVLNLLASAEFVVFTTHELAHASGHSLSAMSHQLARLAKNGLITAVTRGVWANTRHPFFEPMACVPAILGNEQGYVSFLSALYHHGALSQIPARIHIATTGTPRLLESPVGTFELFRIKPELHQLGVDWADARLPFRIASVEKALFDTLYISTRRGRRFAKLAELELGESGFSARRFKALTEALLPNKRLAVAVSRRYDQLDSRMVSAADDE